MTRLRMGHPARPRPRRGVRAGRLPIRSLLAALATLTVPVALPVATAPAAWAHSTLISSSPAADSVLATPPTRVELVFNEQIRDFQPRIAITVGDHDPIEVTPVVDGATVTADLAGVRWPAGGGTGGAVAWKVGYRVVSADGHPVSGLVPFSVGVGVGVGAGPASGSGGATSGGATTDATSAGAPAAGSPTAGEPGAPATAAPAAGGGSSGPLWIGVAVAVGAALVVALVVVRRRARPSGPRADGPDR